MKAEEKELLLKDLCARLPYGVIVTNNVIQGEFLSIEINISKAEIIVYFRILSSSVVADTISNIKPYLRPMSSMTEEEKKELNNVLEYQYYSDDSCMCESTDWLNAHHLDYRGLIEKGLALEAPEGMYEI